MRPTFASSQSDSLPLHVVSPETLDAWQQAQSPEIRDWLDRNCFGASFGQLLLLPEPVCGAVFGIGSADNLPRHRFILAKAQSALPAGTYHIVDHTGLDPSEQALGWLFSQYRFARYRSAKDSGARLKLSKECDANRLEAIAAGEWLTRDLINTPANDMGPAELEDAARALAESHNASFSVIRGDELLAENHPMIHTVGRASAREPRLLELNWGGSGPTLALVGKGVCFDTGGLNLKPGASMGLMKKDMGGAATVLGLAQMIMELKLPIRLRVLIPAVENSVSADAFRPGDVLTSRKGLSVEINNTDAEGRLVLADALALADETPPDLMISMATLTGAARVAVGPDLAPFYASQSDLADALRKAAEKAADPVWEMPFHPPYESMIEPAIADLDNAPKGGFAGSVTAALFLKRFVTETPKYLHFDIYGWQPKPAPGRPVGGVGQGARAILDALPELLEF